LKPYGISTNGTASKSCSIEASSRGIETLTESSEYSFEVTVVVLRPAQGALKQPFMVALPKYPLVVVLRPAQGALKHAGVFPIIANEPVVVLRPAQGALKLGNDASNKSK